MLIEHGETEICKTYPGLDEDLYITAEAEAFVKWHAGQLTWAEALRDSPHPARRSVVARTSVPDLERPQHVRPHQARPGPRRARTDLACRRHRITRRVVAEPVDDARHVRFEVAGMRDVQHAGASRAAVLEVVGRPPGTRTNETGAASIHRSPTSKLIVPSST